MDILMTEDFDAVFYNGPMTKLQTTQPLVDTVRQRLYIRLRSFREEWFLDTRYGVPYFQSILGKKVTKGAVDLIFQTEILNVVGVKQITSFESTFNNRTYTLKFSVKVADGTDTGIITVSPIS